MDAQHCKCTTCHWVYSLKWLPLHQSSPRSSKICDEARLILWGQPWYQSKKKDTTRCKNCQYNTSKPGLPCLVVQWVRLWAPNAEGLGLIPGQGTRSHMRQLKRSRMLQLRPSATKKKKLANQSQQHIKRTIHHESSGIYIQDAGMIQFMQISQCDTSH